MAVVAEDEVVAAAGRLFFFLLLRGPLPLPLEFGRGTPLAGASPCRLEAPGRTGLPAASTGAHSQHMNCQFSSLRQQSPYPRPTGPVSFLTTSAVRPPVLGMRFLKMTRPTLECTSAIEHMMQGSCVVKSVRPVKR